MIYIIPDTYNFKHTQNWLARCDNVSTITDMERYVPWYLDCNRDRYPYWFGHLDSRNKILFESLQNYFNKTSPLVQSFKEKLVAFKL